MQACIRITFYGREEYVDLPANADQFRTVLDAAKRLAARKTDVASHYRIDISADTAAVIAIAEIQAVTFLASDGGRPDAPVVDASGQLTETGAALFLKGRRQPVMLRTTRPGPFREMIFELTSSDYGAHDMGCVMLADEHDNPVFLVLDELQYALVSRELLEA